MIIFKDDFYNSKDQSKSYSAVPEKTHKYTTPDATVKNNKLYIKRAYTKQLLLMPDTDEFKLSVDLSYHGPAELSGKENMGWGIFFGYDKEKRTGYKLVIKYTESKKTVELILYMIDGVNKYQLEREILEGMVIPSDTEVNIEITVQTGCIKILMQDRTVCFSAETKRGIIAFTKETGVCETAFSNVTVWGEKTSKNRIWESVFKIPRTDGGVLDYNLKISIEKYDNKSDLYEINYELTGGAYENHCDYKVAHCWVWDYDVFCGLYFSFGKEKFYLSKDKLVFVDNDYPNLKKLLNGKDIPFCGSFKTEKSIEINNVFIGYDKRFSLCAGNMVSDRMFTYDKSGKLLFIGKPLNAECFFNIRSNKNKEIARRIPKNSVDYCDALFHAQTNHYFINEEIPEFYIDVYSKIDYKYLKFYAELENTYFEKIKELEVTEQMQSDNVFADCGYKKYSFKIKIESQKQGVYHIKFICLCGNNKKYEHTSAFEVIDDSTEESPQETSKLPNIYCGDGFPTYYSTYDMATVRPDFNIMHYINGSLHIPEFAKRRKTWELLKLYHRKSFIWMTMRALSETYSGYASDYADVIKNADYLNYIYPGIEDAHIYYRYETGTTINFDAEKVQELYISFLKENASLKSVFPPLKNGKIDPKKWMNIPCDLYDKWVSYINKSVQPLFKEQWDEIKRLNPKIERFSYGPYPVYLGNHAGGYSTKWRGFSSESLEDAFKGGFMKLEDYPFVCGYQSHNCAWYMSTIKLNHKDLCIAPDLYDSFGADCPDGAVGFAYPTMGESYAPPYQTVTQLFEYIYNTAIFNNGEFYYWDDNLINMYDHISHEPEKRFKVFLKAWKIFLDHKPKKPLGKIAYIADYTYECDRRTKLDDISIYNINQTAMSVIHEVNAEMGVPQGFMTKWDSFKMLDEQDVKILVLPSLDNVSQEITDKLKRMYNNGCSLIATGNINGLEEIFGVTSQNLRKYVSKIRYKNETENVYPYNCEFFYETDGAEVIVDSDGKGVILKKERAMLLNVSLGELGVDSIVMPDLPYCERANISKLIRCAIADFINENLNPKVRTDKGCGINIMQDVNGETLLTLTDYSPFGDLKEHEISVTFDGINISEVKSLTYDDNDIKMNLFEENDIIKGFSTLIRPHETLIFKID